MNYKNENINIKKSWNKIKESHNEDKEEREEENNENLRHEIRTGIILKRDYK